MKNKLMLCVALVFAMLKFTPNLDAQVTCSNDNTSLGSSCLKTLFPIDPNPNLRVKVLRNGSYLPSVWNATIDKFDIGKTLQIKLIDTVSGNFCLSTLNVTDNSKPTFTCPPTDSIFCNQIGIGYLPLISQTGGPTNIFDCSNTYTNYADYIYISTNNCTPILTEPSNFLLTNAFDPVLASNNTIKIIIRNHIVSDVYGNKDSCYQIIYIKKQSLSNVVMPHDTMISCLNANTSIANLGIPKYKDGTAITNLCGISIINSPDEITPTCPGSYKLRRPWLVMDNCAVGPNNMIQSIQVIQVNDTTAPVVSGLVTDYQYTSNDSYYPRNLIFNFDGRNINVTPLQNSKNCGSNPIITIKGYDLDCSAGAIIVNSNNSLVTKLSTNFNPTTKETTVIFKGNFPTIGTYSILFTATDSCSLSNTTKMITFNVIDNIRPTAVCDQLTQIALTNDGTGTVNAITFDNGSKDNCSRIDEFKVRRVTNCVGGNQVTNPDNSFYDSVEFNCCDIGDTVMVVLRVKDESGNTNQCMVSTLIEDKIRPNCIPPVDRNIACNNPTLNIFDVSNFGDPIVNDNCSFDTTYTVVRNINNCKTGTITRTWTVKERDGYKYQTQCSQRINITSYADFVVDFPEDTTVTCFAALNIGVADKLDLLNRPNTVDGYVQNLGCGNLAVNITDEVFTTVPGSCYKIMRKYTVIDWCKFQSNPSQPNSCSGNYSTNGFVARGSTSRLFRQSDLGTSNDGIVCYTQIITVNDNQAPMFLRKGRDTVVKDYSAEIECNGDTLSCDGIYTDSVKASDFCGNILLSNSLNYKWSVFNKNTGLLFKSGIGNYLYENRKNGNNDCTDIQRNGLELPYNSPFIIKWQVEDNCGNIGYLEDTVKVIDFKKPSIYCKKATYELARMGNPVVTMAMINVNDLIGSYSKDNCTPSQLIKKGIRRRGTGAGFPMTGGIPDTVVNATCNDLLSGIVIIEVWVMDLAGNMDFCIDTVSIQNNMNACVPLTQNITLAGKITDEMKEPVNAVQIVALMNGLQFANDNTNNSGSYNLSLMQGAFYKVKATKTDDLLNGVTTKDIVDINKHILGVEVLNSPYKLIAADVNNSGNITSLDMLEIRKAILRKTNSFTNNNSWRFVDKGHVFQDPKNPFGSTIPELVNINTASNVNANFVGVKIGDVNCSATPNALNNNAITRNNDVFVLEYIKAEESNDRSYTLNFGKERFNGFQFALDFDNKELYDISAIGLDGFGISNYNFIQNKVLISWNGKVTSDNPQLIIHVSNTNRINDVDNEALISQFYNDDNTKLIALQSKNPIPNQSFELYQNNPNPFELSTVIGFSLPQAMYATLQIMDNTGKVVKMIQQDFYKGLNKVFIEKDEIGASGIYYYQLKTPEFTATKKMVLLKQ